MEKKIIKALPRGIRFFAMLLLYILPVSGYAQLTGNILEIDYPPSLGAGERLNVTFTVENTGEGTWRNVCAYVGYSFSDSGDTSFSINTCYGLGTLEADATATVSCSSEDALPASTAKIWAGVGTPFG